MWGVRISGRKEGDKRGYQEVRKFEIYYMYIYMRTA
jgi:hypothetical protein